MCLLWFLKGTVFEETKAEAGCFCERKSVAVCSYEKILAEKRGEGLPDKCQNQMPLFQWTRLDINLC